MTTAYRIKEVADRSGFTPATLRYYEEIGLLPTSARTPAGYRPYDEHTLERLAFIARAKQLGCMLEEFADLANAWDGGQRGPVQDRLRSVVADKLAGAGIAAIVLARRHRRRTARGASAPTTMAVDVPVVRTPQ